MGIQLTVYGLLSDSRDCQRCKYSYYKKEVFTYYKFSLCYGIHLRYKELAQKWHPSLHADNKSEAITKYRQVTEAFEVLSNGMNIFFVVIILFFF